MRKTIVFTVAALLAASPTRADVLEQAVTDQAAHLTPEEATVIVAAAREFATEEFPAATLLGLAAVESTYYRDSVSRRIDGTWDPEARRWVGGTRRMGRWRADTRPPRAVGSFFCGITQVTARTWKACLAMRSYRKALKAAAAHLAYWHRRGKTISRALQGYGCGNSGMDGACSGYARRVLKRARLFVE